MKVKVCVVVDPGGGDWIFAIVVLEKEAGKMRRVRSLGLKSRLSGVWGALSRSGLMSQESCSIVTVVCS